MNRLLLAGVLALSGCCFRGDSWEASVVVVSPDGKNEIRLWTDPLSYEVARGGAVLIPRTEVGLTVDGVRLKPGTVRDVRTEKRSGSLKTPIYKKASVDLAANETLVSFGPWGLRLVARDDGVAYRFETSFPGRITVNGEIAGISLPSSTETYVNYCWGDWRGDPLQNSWESVTGKMKASEIATPTNVIAYLPLAFRGADGTAVCVTEADLVDYPGWNLRVAPSSPDVLLRGEFARYPKKTAYHETGEMSETKRLRAQRVLSREDYLVRTDGTRTFPWRCFMIAKDFSKLVESDLVRALASPSRIADTAWIRPGKVAWDWWNAMDNQGEEKGCTTRTYERFIDFAAKNGVGYVIFDEGWSRKLNVWECNPQVDVPHLIRYANARGVGIILWMAWAQVVGDEERVASHFARLGAKGFKVDFMDRDDAACVNFLWKFAEACAKEKMLVDYHGMFKPTGMERTWPNVLNFEGIHGLEQMKWYSAKWDMMASDVRSYFIRMSAGPMDYTPGAMDNYPVGSKELYRGTYTNPGSLGTRCRQMAMMTLYEAPLQMLADSPTKYERNMECFSYMAGVPDTWDETVALEGDPDCMCACARRSGETWYAAGMTNADAREFVLDTSFLGAGAWEAEIFRDAADSDENPTHYVHERRKVRVGERLAFAMSSGGGFTARFRR